MSEHVRNRSMTAREETGELERGNSKTSKPMANYVVEGTRKFEKKEQHARA